MSNTMPRCFRCKHPHPLIVGKWKCCPQCGSRWQWNPATGGVLIVKLSVSTVQDGREPTGKPDSHWVCDDHANSAQKCNHEPGRVDALADIPSPSFPKDQSSMPDNPQQPVPDPQPDSPADKSLALLDGFDECGMLEFFFTKIRSLHCLAESDGGFRATIALCSAEVYMLHAMMIVAADLLGLRKPDDEQTPPPDPSPIPPKSGGDPNMN